MCINILLICILYAWCPWRLKEDFKSPRPGVTDGFDVGTGN